MKKTKTRLPNADNFQHQSKKLQLTDFIKQEEVLVVETKTHK